LDEYIRLYPELTQVFQENNITFSKTPPPLGPDGPEEGEPKENIDY
jgi:hypothetical protein